MCVDKGTASEYLITINSAHRHSEENSEETEAKIVFGLERFEVQGQAGNYTLSVCLRESLYLPKVP